MRMNWRQLLNTDRLRRPISKKPPQLNLPAFFEDQDRILFSQPFRRLQAKTQVHPLADNDHVRTRLTHSIEVGTIGYALGTCVGRELLKRHRIRNCSEHDFGLLVQAACFAHDIGNPPFGHIGEQAIRDWFEKNGNNVFNKTVSEAERQDLYKFEGNAQGFRILTQIENYKLKGGMQLTYATLATVMKYPWGSNDDQEGRGKFNYFQAEKSYAEDIALKTGLIPRKVGGWHRHPLAYLVEAADDICYAVIDLEDGIEMGSFGVNEHKRFFRKYLDTAQKIKDYQSFVDDVQRVSFLRAKAISSLVEQVIGVFLDNENDLLEGKFDGALLDHVKDAAFVEKAKNLAYKRVFRHEKKLYTEIASYKIIASLLEAYVEASLSRRSSEKTSHIIDLMGCMRPRKSASRYETLMCVTDFISGMTDRFALGMYRQIMGITTGGMTPAPNVLS